MSLQSIAVACAAGSLLALAPSIAAAQTPAPTPVPFEDFAAQFRKAHGITATDPLTVDVQALFARDWLVAPVGVFDLIYPRAGLEDKARQDQLRTLTVCLVEVQGQWVRWFGVDTASDALAGDLAALKKWVGSAKPQSAKLADPATDLWAYFGAGDKERALAERVRAGFADAAALGYRPSAETRPQILFTPTRREFLDVVSFFGWVDPDRQASFWDPGAARWSECFWNAIQVLSLEDPPVKADAQDPWAGTSMNSKAPTGVVEHVATRSAHSLCTTLFGYRLDPAFESGLCQNVAIALYGRNNSRSGGSGRGNSVDGWSMFVPGGNKNGGHLPGMSADSPWRSTAGADWFVKPLRDSQRVASKDASGGRDKISTFELTATDNVKRLFVRAPFLGLAASQKDVPAQEFLPDYLEFFRAYKSAFAHWLLEEGGGKNAKASHAKLAELLRNVAAATEGATFETLLSECYSQPWSGQDAKPDSLEWSFLVWLSRQK